MNLLNKLPPYQNKKDTVVKTQTVQDITDWLLKQHAANAKLYDKISDYFWAGDPVATAENLFTYLKRHVTYKIEKDKLQTIKAPQAILTERYGDCKHYASFINGVLSSLIRKGYKGFYNLYRFANYKDDTRIPQHVFAVMIFKNEEYWIDPVLDYFNERKQYINKIDKDPNMLQIISGIPGKIGSIDDARRYKAYYNGQYPSRDQWSAQKYQDTINYLQSLRAMEGKPGSLPHDQLWGIQMFVDDTLQGELSTLIKKTSGVESYPGFVQTDVGPGGHLYSHPVASRTPTTPMPNIANTTLVWAPLFLPPYFGKWWAWVNKYAPETGITKVVDDTVQDIRNLSLKIALAPARASFLLLTELDVFGLAQKMDELRHKDFQSLAAFWNNDLQGSVSELNRNIDKGLKGGLGTMGEPVSTSAAIVAALPIVLKVLDLLKKAGINTTAIENAVKSGNSSAMDILNTVLKQNGTIQLPDGSSLKIVNGQLVSVPGHGNTTSNTNTILQSPWLPLAAGAIGLYFFLK